jgi:predicted nuclease of predicted toxin-antitoxin system
MKILVDENISLISVKALRSLRHNVTDIRGTQDQGLTDYFLWELSQQEECLLITTDKGFARYRHEKHCGVLIVRLRQPNRRRIHERVLSVL